MKNLAGLMKQASQMQNRLVELQEQFGRTTMEGRAGNGLVVLTLTGKHEIVSLKIDPKLADPGDMETMQDLIMAAYRDAKAKIDNMMKNEMAAVTGGMDLPPGLLPF